MKKEINYLLVRGVTLRQMRRGTIPKRFGYSRKMVQAITMIVMNVKQTTVALDFSKVWLERVSQNYLMFNGIKNNECGLFTPPPADPTLILWEPAIKDFAIAEENVIANLPDAVKIREDKWRALMKMNRKIRTYVQGIVDEFPEQAAIIVADAHMKLVVPKGGNKRVPAATSTTPGSIELQGSVKYGRQAIEWEISTDPSDPKLWNVLRVPPTLASQTTITGLVSEKWYYTHFRIISKYGPEEWSEIRKVWVK